MNEDSYALVFGFNFFLALAMQTILTSVVIEALKLGIREQVYYSIGNSDSKIFFFFSFWSTVGIIF